uniref:BTB domain-containing protein n=1 Tax=Araneus ventricosus TaxID=182803 RepID=A0A4Y2V059_ARAVE|nr:hypothetical protein AVEN_249560-1 [Araneus ventricosus]
MNMISEIDGDRGTACFTFIWALENYSELPYFSLTSPWFSGEILENTRWHLWLQDEENVNLPVACYIFRGSDEETKGNIDVNFELAILGGDGLPLVTKRGEKCFEEFSQSEWLELIDKNYILEQKERFLPNDTLTLRCQLRVKKSSISGRDICFARTVLGVEKTEFFWTNKEFSQMQPGQKRSLLVQPLQKGAPTVKLTLYLEPTEDEEDVIIEVNLGDLNGIHAAIAKISVVDTYGCIIHSNDKGNLFVARENYSSMDDAKKIPMLLKNKSRSLHNDTLSLLCELKTSFGVVLSRLENCGQSLTTSVRKETSNSLTLCNSDSLGDAEKENDDSNSCCSFCPLKRALVRHVKGGIRPDVCLTNTRTSFYVHKDILGNKSPELRNFVRQNVTSKMFVILTQYLHYLLTYIYTGIVGDMNRDIALDMLEVAKKLRLPDLQQACSEFLESSHHQQACSEFLESSDHQQACSEFSSSSNEQDEVTLLDRHQDGKLKRRVRHLILDAVTSAFF